MRKDYPNQLVADEPTTAHRSGDTGGPSKYVVYTTDAEPGATAREEPLSVPVRLPEAATQIELHGPGHFPRGRGEQAYGVKVTYMQPASERTAKPGRLLRRSKFVPLNEPAYRVQLLDRFPDEDWMAVA